MHKNSADRYRPSRCRPLAAAHEYFTFTGASPSLCIDQQWAAIEPWLPRNQPGPERDDDRRIISGIVHVLKVGCRWRDCPAVYGPATTIYNRFQRWAMRGVSRRLFEASAQASPEKPSFSTAPPPRLTAPQRAEKGGTGLPDRNAQPRSRYALQKSRYLQHSRPIDSTMLFCFRNLSHNVEHDLRICPRLDRRP